jgi:hypothetical protein
MLYKCDDTVRLTGSPARIVINVHNLSHQFLPILMIPLLAALFVLVGLPDYTTGQ